MPEYLHIPPVAQGALAITAVALAVVRLLTASRPFWASTPAWAQKALPALLMAIAAVPTAIEHARSWLDVVVAIVVSGAMFYTASRGDKRPPEDSDGGPRLERSNTDPKLDNVSIIAEAMKPSPPDMSRLHNDAPDEPTKCHKWRHPDWRLQVFGLLAAFLVAGCASLKTVTRAADSAAELACAEFFGAKQKLSIEDAARAFCATREDLEPWTEAILAAKRQAAPKALALHP
jgi:hypothetical protein